MTAQGARDWIDLVGEVISDKFIFFIVVLLLILYFVEKSSLLKPKPYPAMLRSFGRAINNDILTRISELDKRIDDIESTLKSDREADEIRNAKAARVRILRFNGELIRHIRHTKEEFSNALKDVDEYEKYCKSHPEFPNNEAILSIDNIRKQYVKCLEQGDFLPEVTTEE